MSLWLIRCGGRGEHEQKFLDENRVYLTWEGVTRDLAPLTDREALRAFLEERSPDATRSKISNTTGQFHSFLNRMVPGDWFCVPTRRRTIHIGEITGGYTHTPNAEGPYHHHRAVKWIEQDVPRNNFDQDLLNSLGAIMTICKIQRNDAEARIRAMATNGWKSVGISAKPIHAKPSASSSTTHGPPDDDASDLEAEAAPIDLELTARDQIARTLYAQFKGHGMERLVGAILKAQGFTTYEHGKGADGGIDLLAAPGVLGFGSPRVCVQVKSQDSPLDRPALDQLRGTMENVHAEQGLLVCWGGFKKTVYAELPRLFFKVRLWDQDDLIDQFLAHYDRFDAGMKAEVPLKQVWAMASGDEGRQG